MNTIKKIKARVLVGLAVLVAMALPAMGQTLSPRISTLALALSCTNGSTLTIGTSTNLVQGVAATHRMQLCAVIAPLGTTALTKANFCTNLVMTFQYLVGTNVTTDTPFTWTIDNNQLAGGALAAGNTNAITVRTNLPVEACDSLSGIKLGTALGSSTNAAGFSLTVLTAQTP